MELTGHVTFYTTNTNNEPEEMKLNNINPKLLGQDQTMNLLMCVQNASKKFLELTTDAYHNIVLTRDEQIVLPEEG